MSKQIRSFSAFGFLLWSAVGYSAPKTNSLVPNIQNTGSTQQASAARDMEREKRINSLIYKMTLEEKVSLIGGTGFGTHALARLGIPSLNMTDGPLGVRSGRQTAFPAGIALGASFNPTLIEKMGSAMADEVRFIDKNMLLGPCVGLSRVPFGGRNFESLGEDPYLSSRITESYVKGVQERGVLASVKHFALNDQEYERMTIDSHADLRTLFELHFPAYKAAVDAGVWTVMTSYNRVNGHHSTESEFLQNQVLKKMWGFKGFVVSDWEATHSTVEAANAGLDLEMPYGTFFDKKLVQAVKDGKVAKTVIDDKVRRLLRAMDAVGLLPGSSKPKLTKALGPEAPEHQLLARQVANESLVLLKNENAALPLNRKTLKSLALIGPSFSTARVNGGGSSQVSPYRVVTPLAALKRLLGPDVKLMEAIGTELPGDTNPIATENLRPALSSSQHGLTGEYFTNTKLLGKPLLTRLDANVDFDWGSLFDPKLEKNFSVRWTGYLEVEQSGAYQITMTGDDGMRLFLNGKPLVDNWTTHPRTTESANLDLIAGQNYQIRLEYFHTAPGGVLSLGLKMPARLGLQAAIDAAKGADAAVIFTGLGNNIESEGIDRTTMDLPFGQSELIQAVAKVNPRTIVVLNSGNPLSMEQWLAKVPAVVQAWYPGQEGGAAEADMLVGLVNPSGKLPVSFLKRWEDSPAFGNYPGSNGVVNYSEGIFLGYRSYDKRKIVPNFPFGHGLSYTTFNYSNLKVRVDDKQATAPKVHVEFTLTNSGKSAGAEVPQLYIGEQQSVVPRPMRELKGFRKINLGPNQSRQVGFDLTADSFAYFNVDQMKWTVQPDTYHIEIGASSRDIKLAQSIQLQ